MDEDNKWICVWSKKKIVELRSMWVKYHSPKNKPSEKMHPGAKKLGQPPGCPSSNHYHEKIFASLAISTTVAHAVFVRIGG